MFQIQLYNQNLGGDVKGTVSARDMWAQLEIGKHYATWIRDQIRSLELVENIDYISFEVLPEDGRNPKGGRPRIDFYLDIDIAKHIALASRTPKGREYRQALIDLENRTQLIEVPRERPTQVAISIIEDFLRIAELCGSPKSAGLIEAKKAVTPLGIDLTPLLASSAEMDDIPKEDVYLEPTELGSRFGVTAKDMNKRLESMGLQARINKTWEPTDKAEGMCYKHLWSKDSKSGYNLKWNLSRIEPLMAEYFEIPGDVI